MTKDIKESYIYKSIKNYVTKNNTHVKLDYIISELNATKNFELIDKFIQDLGLECTDCMEHFFMFYFGKNIDGYRINFGMKKASNDKMCWTFWIFNSKYDCVYNVRKQRDWWHSTFNFPAELKKFNEWLNQ